MAQALLNIRIRFWSVRLSSSNSQQLSLPDFAWCTKPLTTVQICSVTLTIGLCTQRHRPTSALNQVHPIATNAFLYYRPSCANTSHISGTNQLSYAFLLESQSQFDQPRLSAAKQPCVTVRTFTASPCKSPPSLPQFNLWWGDAGMSGYPALISAL